MISFIPPESGLVTRLAFCMGWTIAAAFVLAIYMCAAAVLIALSPLIAVGIAIWFPFEVCKQHSRKNACRRAFRDAMQQYHEDAAKETNSNHSAPRPAQPAPSPTGGQRGGGTDVPRQ